MMGLKWSRNSRKVPQHHSNVVLRTVGKAGQPSRKRYSIKSKTVTNPPKSRQQWDKGREAVGLHVVLSLQKIKSGSLKRMKRMSLKNWPEERSSIANRLPDGDQKDCPL